MGLLHLQSPFSILGLRYSAYTSKEITSAYRIAARRCHPDRNPSSDFPANHFSLIGAAYAKLVDAGAPLDQFKGYPVIFYPQRYDAFEIPESSAFAVCECGEILPERSALCNTQGCQQLNRKIFNICNACKTPIPEDGFERHFSEHDICHICNEVTDGDHYTLRHPEKICSLCPALNEKGHHLSHVLDECVTCGHLGLVGTLTQFVNHIRNDHFNCPLCREECGDMYRTHFFRVHKFDLQKCCGDNSNIDHYRKAHKWLQCPYQKCELHIAKGKLWEHMMKSHQFKRCLDCPRSEEGFISDKTHFQAHGFEDCPECKQTFYISNLPYHQVSDHGWLLCTYCNRADGSEDELQDHIKEDHCLVVCSVCQQKHLEEKTDIHLLDLHNWLKCSWCNKAFAEKDLRTHIAVSHPQQEFCDCDCNYKDTVPGLNIHKMQSHAWQKCPYCENIESPDQIEQHMNSHQLMTCQDCSMRFPRSQERAHFQHTHQYLQCSFCEHFDSHSKMLIHMQSHLSQSQLQLNSGFSISSANIPVQEGPTRFYNSTKCASCREQKKKCTFNKGSKSECDQCQYRGSSCPGPSERRKRRKA